LPSASEVIEFIFYESQLIYELHKIKLKKKYIEEYSIELKYIEFVMDIFKNIVTNGTYYNPASEHYSDVMAVRCDRCNKKGISACIGYGDYDLCLRCASEVVELMQKNNSKQCLTLMCQEQFSISAETKKNNYLTRMCQEQFSKQSKDNNKVLAKMLQSQFSINKGQNDSRSILDKSECSVESGLSKRIDSPRPKRIN